MHPLPRSLVTEAQSMTAAVSPVSSGRLEPNAAPPKALQAEAVLWFLAAVLGQGMFIVHIAPWRAL